MTSSNPSPVVLLVGRDDWRRDEDLNAVLLDTCRQQGMTVVCEDPAAELIDRARRLERAWPWLPTWARHLLLRCTQLAYALAHPSYLRYLYLRGDRSVSARCNSLRAFIGTMDRPDRVVILSRSSGGRVASLIADELGIGRIICLGYPFKHPRQGDEPARYRHLARLRTPMQILQGRRDVYGGADVANRYPMSATIDLHVIDTDHEFGLAPAERQRVVALMLGAIG